MSTPIFNFADRPRDELEAGCLNDGLIDYLIRHLSTGNTKPIISISEICASKGGLDDSFLTDYNVSPELKESFKIGCDNGFVSKYNLYIENTEPKIQFPEDTFDLLDRNFQEEGENALSTAFKIGRDNRKIFVTKRDLISNATLREQFDDYNKLQNDEKRLKTYAVREDLDNKIKLFNGTTIGGITVRSEIVESVTRCAEYLNTNPESISAEMYKNFPYYFVVTNSRHGHIMILIKIGDVFYTTGFAFPETQRTINTFSDNAHLWFKKGAVFTPDPLFELKTPNMSRLVDFGILNSQTLHLLNSMYFSHIENIYVEYVESIPLKPDGSFDVESRTSDIVLKNFVIVLEHIDYSSFGKNFLPFSKTSKNCVTFTSDIFPNRINCVCSLLKNRGLAGKFVNSAPQNCNKAISANQIRNWCQEIYMLIYTRTMPIDISKFKQIVEWEPTTGGKKYTVKGKYKKNKKQTKKQKKTKTKKYKKIQKNRKTKK